MFTRERLAEIRENLKEKSQDVHQITLPDVRVLSIFFKTGMSLKLIPSIKIPEC